MTVIELHTEEEAPAKHDGTLLYQGEISVVQRIGEQHWRNTLK